MQTQLYALSSCCRLNNPPPTPKSAHAYLREPPRHWPGELGLLRVASTTNCLVNATADRSSYPEQSTPDISAPPYFLHDRAHPVRVPRTDLLGLASGCGTIRQRPNMLGRKWTDADSSTRQEFPGDAAKETIPAWPLDTEWPTRLGDHPDQAKHARIRVNLALIWLSVMGMWLSFPVIDLEESTSRLGLVLLVGSSKQSPEIFARY